jgi:hypothetical protein
MLNDDKLLKSGFIRCWTVRNGVERCGTVGTVKDGGDGSVTMDHNESR